MKQDIIDWGSYGRDIGVEVTGLGHEGSLEGNIEGLGHARIDWSGDDDDDDDLYESIGLEDVVQFDGGDYAGGDYLIEVSADEFAGFFSAVGKLAKSVSRDIKKMGRVVGKVSKAVRPVLVAGAVGSAILFPPAAPAFAGAAAAATLAMQLESKKPRRRTAARRIIKNTKRIATSRKETPLRRQAASRALRGIRTVSRARYKSRIRRKRFAFVVTRTGMVIRVR